MFRKAVLVIAVGLCALVAGAGTTWWAVTTGHLRPGGRIPVHVDGRLVSDSGIMLRGRTYLPVRAMAESLGLSLETYAGADGIYLLSTQTEAGKTPAGANGADH